MVLVYSRRFLSIMYAEYLFSRVCLFTSRSTRTKTPERIRYTEGTARLKCSVTRYSFPHCSFNKLGDIQPKEMFFLIIQRNHNKRWSDNCTVIFRIAQVSIVLFSLQGAERKTRDEERRLKTRQTPEGPNQGQPSTKQHLTFDSLLS